MQKRKQNSIILYLSEIISINDFVPWGSLEPMSFLITCEKLVSKAISRFSLPCIHILNANLQRSKFIMSTWELGRQDIPDLFPTCWTGGEKRLWDPPAQELGGPSRRIQRTGFTQGPPG